MASNPSYSNPNVRKSDKNPAPPQAFRRERSFVLQRAPQVAGNPFHQQRERSFIRDGKNTNGANRAQQQRPQMQSGPARGTKPNIEIYRPPSLRSGEGPPAPGSTAAAGTTNPPAGPSAAGGNRVQFHAVHVDESGAPRLTKSRTSLDLNATPKAPRAAPSAAVVNAAAIKSATQSTPTGTAPAPTPSPLQRSKSMGSQLEAPAAALASAPTTQASAQAAAVNKNGDLPDISQFPEDVQVLLRKVAADPTRAPSRSVMDAVKHLFLRVVESSRYAGPVARYCAYVIEKETSETFLESTLNACQEWYQDRDRLLRSSNVPSQRWVAFINFLSEMYLKLKRRQYQQTSTTKRKVVNGIVLTPDIILLSLLAECCYATLKQPSQHSMQELECLFFILTGIGRDLEQELPAKMAQIMAAIRDSFLESSLPGAAQKTLLQLVELRAAKWQLPATAVKYYYPSMSGTAY